MIKLIAADMDGTLYDNEKQFPPHFWQMLDELWQKNILFAAASGRTYPTLKRNFEKRMQQMLYICDNGALVAKGDKILYASVIDKLLVKQVVEACQAIPDIHMAISGTNGTYMLSYKNKPWHEKIIEACFKSLKIVDSLQEIDDDIVQIAICDKRHPQKNACPILQSQFGRQLEVLPSGEWWMDIMNKGISKGSALIMLQKLYNIKSCETMSFGDYDNDIEMIKASGSGYVMANSPEYMFNCSALVAPKNTDYGVARVIYDKVLNKPYIV